MGNMSPSKQYGRSPAISPKEMEIQKLPNKEIKIIILWMLKEQFIDIRKQFKNKMKSSIKKQKT